MDKISDTLDKISVIIPTKDRPEDLKAAVKSILKQSCKPNQLIIVDQSIDSSSKEKILSMTLDKSIDLKYIYDPLIKGLVDAKRVGVENSVNGIVCFLEDDIILESDYINEILIGFLENKNMVGCSGVIANQPNQSKLYVFFHGIFFRGIYFDPRIKISISESTQQMFKCNVLSGGLSCWRRFVFDHVSFDVNNNFFMLEDIDFSTRVSRVFKDRLFINKKARLDHKWSPLNREMHGLRQQTKLKESIVFYKKRIRWSGSFYGQVLVTIWWLNEAFIQSLKMKSLKPLIGFFSGIWDGINQKVIHE